jgi:hypothetical protein
VFKLLELILLHLVEQFVFLLVVKGVTGDESVDVVQNQVDVSPMDALGHEFRVLAAQLP